MCDCASYMKMTRGTNLMQQLWFIIINISTCFGHLYAHLHEYRLYVTVYGLQHCKENEVLVVGFVLCCSLCCVMVGFSYAVCCTGFRCHIICVMLTGMGGNVEVEWGHAVYDCCNGWMCLVWVWGGWVVCKQLYGGGLKCMLQVLMEKTSRHFHGEGTNDSNYNGNCMNISSGSGQFQSAWVLLERVYVWSPQVLTIFQQHVTLGGPHYKLSGNLNFDCNPYFLHSSKCIPYPFSQTWPIIQNSVQSIN
jgi:hypothetical protein